jgi:hypothetical protein
MLKTFICLFLTMYQGKKDVIKHNMQSTDVNFNEQLNTALVSITTIGYFIPRLLRNNEICKTDDDCPLIMRCCEIGKDKYCCTPNNFVKLQYSYLDEKINN